jgi:hypothetical protein
MVRNYRVNSFLVLLRYLCTLKSQLMTLLPFGFEISRNKWIRDSGALTELDNLLVNTIVCCTFVLYYV